MAGVEVDREVDAVPLVVAHRVAPRLDREEVVDRRLGLEAHRAAAGDGGVADRVARRDRRLVGVGGDRDVGGDPVAVGAEQAARAAGLVLERRRPQVDRQAVLAALGAVLEQAVSRDADTGRDLHALEEATVLDDRGQRLGVGEPALGERRREAQLADLARLHRRLELVDRSGTGHSLRVAPANRAIERSCGVRWSASTGAPVGSRAVAAGVTARPPRVIDVELTGDLVRQVCSAELLLEARSGRALGPVRSG